MVYTLAVPSAIGALLLPHIGSQALSSANFGSTLNSNGARCRHCTPPALLHRQQKYSCLRAVAENTITSADTFEFEEERTAAADEEAVDIPKPHTGIPPTLTVVAGPGARITSVSTGVVVEQDIWDDSLVDQVDLASSFVGGTSFPTHDGTKEDERVNVESVVFPKRVFHDAENNIPSIFTEIKNEVETGEDIAPNTNTEEPETAKESDSDAKGDDSTGSNSEVDDDSSANIRSAMANSALLHRAGIVGNAKKSSRSNGRSSRARTHVNKSGRRGSGGAGAMGRVLGTVRTAAAAAAAEKKLSENNSKGTANESGDENNSLKANLHLSKLKSAVQSTVADMLKPQDAAIQQQSVDLTSYGEGTAKNISPPPGTTSMGLLGEVVRDELPAIPPLPGKLLARSDGYHLQSNKPRVTVRSSVPYTSDDTSIANLRLSVFSRFDEEQQQLFRSRSLEVLNTRRRRGAVVLVAEVPEAEGIGGEQMFPNEIQARIADGHKYGEVGAHSTVVTQEEPSSTSTLTVASVRGATVTSVSPGININRSSPSETTAKGSIIGSIECSHQEFHGTMLGASRPKGSLLYVTEVAVRSDARRCGAGATLMKGVDEVAALRNVETIYLHVDVLNRAACAMYEKCGYRYLDKREPIYAQFTASLNLHDGAMHGRKHYLMCKDRNGGQTTWL